MNGNRRRTQRIEHVFIQALGVVRSESLIEQAAVSLNVRIKIHNFTESISVTG